MFSLAFPLQALCLLLLPATTAQCDGGSILYFPPDLNETPRVLIDEASTTQTFPGVLYIFPMDISTFQCDGTVLQIEYCYSYSSNTARMVSLPVFTLYLLEQTATHFNEIDSMVFSSTPSLEEECVSSSRRCCERQSLQDDFLSSASLPLVFGVVVSPNSHSLLSDTDIGNYYTHNVAELPSINIPIAPTAQEYRLVRFIIDPAIAPPSASPTSTIAPSTLSSEPQPTESSSNPESSSEPPTEPSSNTESTSAPPPSSATSGSSTGSLTPTPTEEPPTTDAGRLTITGLAIIIVLGATVAVGTVTIIILTAVLCIRKTYSLKCGCKDAIANEQSYDYPLHETISIKNNETYTAAMTTEPNEAYATAMTTEPNEAYATAITTEPNEAYATAMTTEPNEAYTTATGIHNEAYAANPTANTDHEYDYIVL